MVDDNPMNLAEVRLENLKFCNERPHIRVVFSTKIKHSTSKGCEK